MFDVSRQMRSLRADAIAVNHLPELVDISQKQQQQQQHHQQSTLLDDISQAALYPPLVEQVFVHFENVFPDICARWIINTSASGQRRMIASAIARLLPFAPHLAAFLRTSGGTSDENEQQSPAQLSLTQFDEAALSKLDDSNLLESLVTLWRLLNFDFRTYSCIASMSYLQVLFRHDSLPVRYMAVRVFCLLLHASNYKLEALICEHVGTSDANMGIIDGVEIDFSFISLYEQHRAQKVVDLQRQVKDSMTGESHEQCLQSLTPFVVRYGEVVLPCPRGQAAASSTLIMTKTTTKNLERLAILLRAEDPILIYGSAGAGKTSLVHEVATQLGKYSDMVTLHLNEQTDAKMLVGLYSTNGRPGNFQWRPGVLTTAVREGRWVFVEDLDRAPTEVLSTLLPLIERRELLIPSRGERIRAAHGFRILATVRSIRGMNGIQNLPSFVGVRFWQTLCAEPLPGPEIEEVVLRTHTMLRKFLPGIMAVYNRLSQLSDNPRHMFRGRNTMDRQMNFRDLRKWCRRLEECLLAAGSTTGDEPITETTRDWMFMEALDCFVGHCPNVESCKHLAYMIAEEMHLSKEKADHYLAANIPPLEDNERVFRVGRAQLRKKKSPARVQISKGLFANTAHAKRLLEQIAVAIRLQEPVLLVGETGIGKTTVVQQLADSLGHKLIAVNLSQQSEVGDLLGGFKPVNVRRLAMPLKEEFEDLFTATGISVSKNQKYLDQIGRCFAKSQWLKVAKLWKQAPPKVDRIITEMRLRHMRRVDSQQGVTDPGEEQAAKRRKTQSKLDSLLELKPRWASFIKKLEQFEVQLSSGSASFAFTFVEGNLVKAVRNGDWVLLDEINLASPDTLESIADLLNGPEERPFILLTETGEIEKIVAHPDFRIFGAMNPATDVGKRDLPAGIRSRFTELYVKSPDGDFKDLLTIIKKYLGNGGFKMDQAADDIARLYLNIKRMAEEKRLVDGANEVPHFSLRTLTRVLSYVDSISPIYGVRRALYEGFSMGFLTLLNQESEKLLLPLIYHHLLDEHGGPRSLLSQPPKKPKDGYQYVKFQNRDRNRHYWLCQGAEAPFQRDDYIITPCVERNLLNLVRATSTRRFPVLIQGPTSAGKTSMIEYLANFTGNTFVRINNHQHTDLQEYLGTYVSGLDGKLRFQEGLLVQAMRQGHWIVLDELNLAPTDVLEALNRLLDDNRELLIPETQELVRPHENFILFATQNPPGLYGGRKALSRAFRNRFLELHFDDIPEDEMEYILRHKCRNTSPSDCRRIVTVYKELSRLRQTSRLFEQKESFATLRDLFRWALREGDTREDIAAHGFMLLAERVRVQQERIAVKEVIEKVFKVRIDPRELYSASTAAELKQVASRTNSLGIVWTQAMRRLYVLVSRAIQNNEPVLLVGETGCGKTTVVQLLAEVLNQKLHIVNAHQNTETGDLIGSQRPVRNRNAILNVLNADLTSALQALQDDVPDDLETKLTMYDALNPSLKTTIPEAIRERISLNATRSKALFEWSDGALIEAMRGGHFFLLDEISLADDSVLERLNSVLEPRRTLLLAEKGIDNSFVAAAEGFQFFATMNPGGDFGKKELSPALRNRFTEIWVPPLFESEDIYDIIKAKLTDNSKHLAATMIEFARWFAQTFRSTASSLFSVREILVWVDFMNNFQANSPLTAFLNGAAAVFIDSIGANPSALLAMDQVTIGDQRQHCLEKLGQLVGQDVVRIYMTEPALVITGDMLSIGDFSILRNPSGAEDPTFAFHVPTTKKTVMRVARALQMQKPILLEGSPGVGKTTLVSALSQACGRPLTRVNLSDQTDLMDLFGSDVPVEGEGAGNFAWTDAPFLQAMQKGEWVLLDEMNLASQSVLEGLNACLDHRGEVFVPELDRVFQRHPDFRLFAAQNPHHQGGGRKGLPASFVNRFIVVYVDAFEDEDLRLIASHEFPEVDNEVITHLVELISKIEHQITVEKRFASQGGPWEFNLRDVLRWLNLLSSSDPLLSTAQIDDFFDIVIRQRFRTSRDRSEIDQIFADVVGREPRSHSLYHDVNSRFGQVGLALMKRNLIVQPEALPSIDVVPRLAELESIMMCVNQNIPCILSGSSGYGKSALLSYVAAISGKPLVIFPMNADIDTMDLVGGFEQADPLRKSNAALAELQAYLQSSVMSLAPSAAPDGVLHLLHLLDGHNGNSNCLPGILSAIEHLLTQLAPDSEAGRKLHRVAQLLRGPLNMSDPRFEWLDGIIVKALLAGHWLVLDNANMCSASVLDRLNSLLEPDGFLSINEHCDSDGKPRIIKPHSDFRIFLTMDPKYGELSRAMRNRAVEIHLTSPSPTWSASLGKISLVEGGLHRLHRLEQSTNNLMVSQSSGQVAQIAADHLSIEDVAILPRFIRQCSTPSSAHSDFLTSVERLVQFLETTKGSRLLLEIKSLYSTISSAATQAAPTTQSIHMLNNHTLVKLLPNEIISAWMGERLERAWSLHDLRQLILDQESKAQSSKLVSLNRLQRSLISGRVAAVSKDSTVNIGVFLSTTLAAVEDYLTYGVESYEQFLIRLQLLTFLELFLRQSVSLTSDPDFDEAYFQAHLTLGKKKLHYFSQSAITAADSTFVASLATQLSDKFHSGFQLFSGLSMEALWPALRPMPIASKAAFDRSMILGQIAMRFDAIRWKVSSSISDMARAQQTLFEAYVLVRNDALSSDELVRDLTSFIGELEIRTGPASQEVKPFFTAEFEYLRQLSIFKSSKGGNPNVELHNQLLAVSNAPTKTVMKLSDDSNQRTPSLRIVARLAISNAFNWDGKLTLRLWDKLLSMKSVSLGSLAVLEAELPILGQHLTASTLQIAKEPLRPLNGLLKDVLLEVLGAHHAKIRAAMVACFARLESDAASLSNIIRSGLTSSDPLLVDLGQAVDAPHLYEIVSKHFVPAAAALVAADAHQTQTQTAQFSALAWLHFSIGLSELYIPDKIFDPRLQPKAELDFHEGLEATLHGKLSVVKAFQKGFTGHSASPRTGLLEAQLNRLGPSPEGTQPIYRPAESELGQIHAEFTNMLKTIKGPTLRSMVTQPNLSSINNGDMEGLNLVRQNTIRLVDRLSSSFEAYHDMVRPAIDILKCLLVALSLCDATRAATLEPATMRLTNAMPFFGSSRPDLQEADYGSNPFEFLNLASTCVAVDGLQSLRSTDREHVFRCFHGFLDDWNKKLEADKKAEAARTSMYRFRGTLEDEEELDLQEFNELFPTFDEDGLPSRSTPSSDLVRTTSLKVAEAHRKIFFERQKPCIAFYESSMAAAQCSFKELQMQTDIDRTINAKMLTSVMLLLGEKMDELQTPVSGKNYNFYADSNMVEARQLVTLSLRVKTRFRELQLIDEIGYLQPLADVIQACDSLLEQVHGEPLAKLLPKVEQLHAHVYEWQTGGWASQKYAVSALHDLLTDTILRWRRLELSTWANLFDMEQKKCQDDAYSWWFVAYQVVIAMPLTMIDSRPNLESYAKSLVENLELYFTTSIVGQFKTRLALLHQLLCHLCALAKDHPVLRIICAAVENFLQYFSRYEKAADAAIQKGRLTIDKKMKDVLLTTSWKDTNINALRESARKSHLKLFRLVRKFRGVLGQEMKIVIAQGLHDEDIKLSPGAASEPAALTNTAPVNVNHLDLCLPDWLQKHKRLANQSRTVLIIRNVVCSQDISGSATNLVLSFVNELNISMTELRKETPSIPTDENKSMIKHLKTRKRKLFADTLRDLRVMGISNNLSQNKLAQQNCLAVVLANLATIDSLDDVLAAEAEYFLHKTLDIAPKAREALREHSEDLTSADVARSVGFIEGLISFTVTQRQQLGSTMNAHSSLQTAVRKFKSLGDGLHIGRLKRKIRDYSWPHVLGWLAHSLQFAARAIQVHEKVGMISNGSIVEKLKDWATRIATRSSTIESLPTLPPLVSSATHEKLEQDILADVRDLGRDLASVMEARADLEFILSHLTAWTNVEPATVGAHLENVQMSVFADAIAKLSDTVLVAIQGVKKESTALAMPVDPNEPAWLLKRNDVFSAIMRKLHTGEIERSVLYCTELAQQVCLDDPLVSMAAMSIIGLASPILDEFLSLCQQCITQSQRLNRASAYMAYNLTKSFNQIASQGFCTPQEQSDEPSGDAGQLEAGTGLGDGEGAEDISKDIQPDEDLTELAQQADAKQNGDIEDEKDAVDMKDEELEGEMGSVAGEDDDDEEGSRKGDEKDEDADDMDEEAGDVDDLDPSAVDEKMWDGDDDDGKADKQQQGNETMGRKDEDEQMAPDEATKQREEDQKPENDEDNAESRGEDQQQADAEEDEDEPGCPEELNRQDQNVQKNDALELPDDMDLDFDDKDGDSDSDSLDDISEAEDKSADAEQEQHAGKDESPDALDELTPQQVKRDMEDEAQHSEDEIDEGEEDQEGTADSANDVNEEVDENMDQDLGEDSKEEDAQPNTNPPPDNANAAVDKAAPSDVKSSGLDENQQSAEPDDAFQAQAAEQDHGDVGDGAADQDAVAASKGAASRLNEKVDSHRQEQDAEEEAAKSSNPFRAAGSALEKCYRQNADIMEAQRNTSDQSSKEKQDIGQGKHEFQHLQNDDDVADTQAMGTADEDQAQPMDDSMMIDDDDEDGKGDGLDHGMEDDADDETMQEKADKTKSTDDAAEDGGPDETDKNKKHAGVQTRQGNYDREQSPSEASAGVADDEPVPDEGVDETSEQLSVTHISAEEARGLRDYRECLEQWAELQAKSHALSLSLTSQLRLILTPSQSTKLSGSFRTGKRLNIKRIIPYIASSYKRDKIWMRRAIPTKRTYQILLCVDDSKSMGDSASGRLAMESLVMVSRSLTMLEAGQVGVIGFGSDVFVAHELTDPFAADAGARVLQKFTFSQDRTDVELLVRQTIDRFRAARQQQQQQQSSSDLWQLALVLSDGLTPSGTHDAVGRLLREAMEDRIMVVFIIVEDGSGKGSSVLDLKKARFIRSDGDGETKVVISRYLDSFPFQYYLIVRDLEELPRALAGLLRTWFAEVTR